MAYSVSVLEKGIFGNKRYHVLSCLADAATQNIDTGLKAIDWHILSPKSCTTAALKAYPNSGAGGTSLAGILGVSGAVSGDIFTVIAFGKA